VGFTSDLLQWVDAHKNNIVKGFTKKYGVHKLVYFETYDEYDATLQREKQIKEWKREWKIKLIEQGNPLLQNLWDETLKNG
jgi:putative endonuclease